MVRRVRKEAQEDRKDHNLKAIESRLFSAINKGFLQKLPEDDKQKILEDLIGQLPGEPSQDADLELLRKVLLKLLQKRISPIISFDEFLFNYFCSIEGGGDKPLSLEQLKRTFKLDPESFLPTHAKPDFKTLPEEFASTRPVKTLYQPNAGLHAYIHWAVKSENNGNAAGQIAKLLTLFGDSGSALDYLQTYIKQHSVSPQPVHDACLFSLPSASSWTAPVWKALVKKHDYTPSLMGLLPLAADIETALNTAGIPFNNTITIDALLQTATALTYGDESVQINPAAAKVFKQYQLPKVVFEQYLRLKPIDDDKQIPNLTISVRVEDGKELTISRLSSTDPRAAVLGHITGNCQSLGNEYGGDCARYGITKANSGFYVVTLGKDKIVAQTWAWRNEDTLVFDSIEANEAAFSGQPFLLCDLFRVLAEGIVEHQESGIKRVLVGAGGRTPTIAGIPMKGDDKPMAIPDYIGHTDAREQRRITISLNELRYSVGLPEGTTSAGVLAGADRIASIETWLEFFYHYNVYTLQHPLWKGALRILLKVIASARDLLSVIKFLSADQRAVVLEVVKGQLPQLIGTVGDLCKALNSFSAEQGLVVLEAVKGQLPQLIGTVSDLCKVLNSISTEQYSVVLGAVKDQLPQLVKTIKAFYLACRGLSPSQRAMVAEAVKGQLPQLINTVDDLCNILNFLSADQCTAVVEAIKGRLPQLTIAADRFCYVLRRLSPDQRAVVVDEIANCQIKILQVPAAIKASVSKQIYGFLSAQEHAKLTSDSAIANYSSSNRNNRVCFFSSLADDEPETPSLWKNPLYKT